jgi:hypothetical protein
MIDIKPWYLSRTIWASIVTVLLATASAGGVPVDRIEQSELVDLLLQMAAIGAGLVTLYGRLVARNRIG